MVAVPKSGRIPWERQQPFGCDLALHVRLNGDGGQQAHPLPLVVQQGLLVVVVGLAHGGKLVGVRRQKSSYARWMTERAKASALTMVSGFFGAKFDLDNNESAVCREEGRETDHW